MAAAVLAPTAVSPRGGILLNASPCSSPALPHSIPQTPSSQSLSSSTSDASSSSWFRHSTHDMQRSASAPGAPRRRIRFAPLPDPRADETDNTSVTEASETHDPISSSKLLATEGTELSPKVSPASSTSSTHSTITAPTKKPALSLLRPLAFLKRAPSPCPSVGSDSEPGSSSSRLARISTEDILTLGTINLFRPSSRTTAAAEGDRRSRRYSDSSPEDDSNPAKKRAWRASVGPSASPRLASQPLGGARSAPSSPQQSIHMLNGRVYGKRKAAAARGQNLFASARDEPEFVEWGYGGMGSVHADHAGHAMYRNLQSRGTAIFEGGRGAGSSNGGRSGPAEDEDDGSGMGWVKRRREQREREKKEAEARERAAREAQKRGDQAAEDADVESGVEEKVAPAPAVSVAPAVAAEEIEPARVASPASENHHVLKTIAVPAHHRHHSHSSHHKSASISRAMSPPAAEEPKHAEAVRTESPVQAEATGEDEKDGSSNESGSGSEAEDNEIENENEVENEDEDEEDDEDFRKTAIGAGMEIVSRHKEER